MRRLLKPSSHLFLFACALLGWAVLLGQPRGGAAKAVVMQAGLPATTITFEEPGLAPGPVESITKDGVTVRFLRRVEIFRPAVATHSAPWALLNASQDAVGDETGHQKPLIFSFSRLQRMVGVRVGLDAADVPGSNVSASLIVYNACGDEIGRDRVELGNGPRPIATGLFVDAGSDRIHQVKIEYTGLNAEAIDSLVFQAGAVAAPLCFASPVITITSPTEGATINCSTVNVSGTIRSASNVTLTLNGTPAAARRVDVNQFAFSTQLTLPAGTTRIEARATDEAGGVGSASRSLNYLSPASINVTGVSFTQSGIFDASLPALPARRVAHKTGLFRVGLQIRTADDRSASIERAELQVTGAGVTYAAAGLNYPAGTAFRTSGAERILDGRFVYFFVNGAWLPPGYPLSFTLRLYDACGTQVFERRLVSDWLFRVMPGMTMLIVPQHRALDDDYTRGLVQMLHHFARMFPVSDGVADLDSDRQAGIRFKITAPVSYRDHTDPNSGFRTDPIPYEQGFLLQNHNVATAFNAGHISNPASIPFAFRAGEFLTFAGPEDANRNGVFDADEVARVLIDGRLPGDEELTDWRRRAANLGSFLHNQAEAQRMSWNRAHGDIRQRAKRAVATVTSQQNFANWTGNSGAPWATIDAGSATQFVGAAFPHEIGHTFGFRHTDDSGRGCGISGLGINLLTRETFTSPTSVMCSGIRNPKDYFLLPAQYDQLFDRFAAGEELRISFSEGDGSARAALRMEFATASTKAQATNAEQTFTLIGSIGQDGSVKVFESALAPADLPLTDEAKQSEYSVAFLDQQERVLAESPFAVSFATEDQPKDWPAAVLPSAPFSVVRPFPAGTVAVELRRAGKTLKQLALSANAPKLDSVKVDSSKLQLGEIQIEWQGSDPDGEALTYSLSISNDDGKTFRPVEGGVKTNALVVATDGLPGGPNVRIKVLASDGFHTAEALSEPFFLPNHAPVAMIFAPAEKAIFTEGEAIYAQGAALDTEDGWLDSATLQWQLVSAKGQETLNTGDELFLKSLPAGTYTLRLIAVDRTGLEGTHERVIVVQAEVPGKAAENAKL